MLGPCLSDRGPRGDTKGPESMQSPAQCGSLPGRRSADGELERVPACSQEDGKPQRVQANPPQTVGQGELSSGCAGVAVRPWLSLQSGHG